ncbi:class E sortase [Rubrobacter indicoceani]|uniref:class E sortase n=1 Tax=Rubrobacter indicoceani TaxID=2051957 RepID=UPI001F08C3EA|nr:class E sortase [Rubrobacter indicoceani]
MKVYRSNRFGLGELGCRPAKPPKPQKARAPEESAPGREPFQTARPTSRRELRREKTPSKKTAAGRRRRPLAGLLSVLMVLAGLGVVGYSVFGSSMVGIANSVVNPAPVPTDNELTLTVPGMSRVDDDPVYTAQASDTAMLDRGAVHVEGTGYPWEEEANVYIAGHRIGYAGSDSFFQFYDLNKLESGDEILLTDSNGTEYTYTVFNKITVSPTDAQVLDPIPGKNIVSLQTCTLPDYSRRLIVQGELTTVA